MFRLFLLLLALLLLGTVAPAEIPRNVVLAVIAADKDETYALAEGVRLVRDQYGFGKGQLPISRIPAGKLTPQDYQRVGFTPDSLPVIALMKVSSSDNLERVLGNPPYIFRNVKKPVLAAQVLLCRWAELSKVPVPTDLRNLAAIFQPNRVFILNTADSNQRVEATARQLEQLKSACSISDQDLPVLSTTYHDGLLGEEEYTRLGFVSDAFPIVCLVQMSEAANPSKIVGDGILRWSYNAKWSARQILRLWARFTNRTLADLSDQGDGFSALESGWLPATAGPRLPAGQLAHYQCLLGNFRYGVGGRVWLQTSGKIVAANGSTVATLATLDFKPEAGQGEPPTIYRVESEVLAPSAAGKYTLEVEIRDKMGATRTTVSLPFEI